jgi:hypothetical protein
MWALVEDRQLNCGGTSGLLHLQASQVTNALLPDRYRKSRSGMVIFRTQDQIDSVCPLLDKWTSGHLSSTDFIRVSALASYTYPR